MREKRAITNRRLDALPYFEPALIAASLAYLAAEIWVNDGILFVEPNQIDELQNYQFISGIGAALLVIRLLSALDIASVAIAALVVGVLVVKGQSWMVNSLVDGTTTDERRAAAQVTLLRSGLTSGVVTLDGVGPSITGDTVSLRTFNALIALSSWKNDAHLSAIRESMPNILRFEVQDGVNKELPEAYVKYKKAVETDLVGGYKKMQDERLNIDRLVSEQLSAFHTKFTAFILNLKNCGHDTECQVKTIDQYRNYVTKIAGRYIPWQSFCTQRESTHLAQTGSGRLENVTETKLDCDLSIAEFGERMKAVAGVADTFAQFAASRPVQASMQAALRLPESVEVKPDWTFEQFAVQVGTRQFEANLKAAQKSFENPIGVADEGRDFVRAIVIQPVALLFSIGFTLANLGQLSGEKLRKIVPKLPAVKAKAIATAALVILCLADGDSVNITPSTDLAVRIATGAEHLLLFWK